MTDDLDMTSRGDADVCCICDAKATFFGAEVVLTRHRAEFRRCESCGAVFAADPHWLPQAYERTIAAQDIGLVGRNISASLATSTLIRLGFRTAERFVDFGGGNGMFVRLMRDAGFDFRYFDRHGPNLFAAGHEVELDGSWTAQLATAFEVMEHLRRPRDELRDLLAASEALFFTTTCLPDPAPALGDWWYYALEAGQHITFYTPRSLDILAAHFGLRRVSSGPYHLFTSEAVSRAAFRAATSARLSQYLAPLARRPSLLPADYERLTGKRIG